MSERASERPYPPKYWYAYPLLYVKNQTRVNLVKGLVSEETVVLRQWGSETRKFGLLTELIM